MKTLVYYGLGIGAAAALLAGCGEAVPPAMAPPGTKSAQTARAASWMSPAAKSQDLVYVVPEYAHNVSVYTYPGGALVGSLTNANENPIGDCVDKAGDVFIVNLDLDTGKFGPGDVVEYRHGGTRPIETLNPGGEPTGCAVDPTTGDLAVTRNKSVLVYPHAKGPPANYYNLHMDGYYYCGYDGRGDLFVNGYDRSSNTYQLAELPVGQKHLTLLTFSKRPRIRLILGGIQWDGKHVVIGNGETVKYSSVYRLAIIGTKARILDSTTLEHGGFPGSTQFWIEGDTIIAPCVRVDAEKLNNKFGLWKYPQGTLIKFVRDRDGPWAVTVSLAQR